MKVPMKKNGVNKQDGFSLIELTIVLSVLTLLALQSVQWFAAQARQNYEDINARSLSLLSQAAMGYYADNLAWPVSPAELVTSQHLAIFRNVNTSGNPFVFTITPVTVANPRPALRISTQFDTVAEARDVEGKFGTTASVVGTTLTLGVSVPGTEISHDHLVPRDGSRDVFGDLEFNGANIDLGNNRIFNAARITVTQGDNSGLVLADTVTADAMNANTFTYTNPTP